MTDQAFRILHLSAEVRCKIYDYYLEHAINDGHDSEVEHFDFDPFDTLLGTRRHRATWSLLHVNRQLRSEAMHRLATGHACRLTGQRASSYILTMPSAYLRRIKEVRLYVNSRLFIEAKPNANNLMDLFRATIDNIRTSVDVLMALQSLVYLAKFSETLKAVTIVFMEGYGREYGGDRTEPDREMAPTLKAIWVQSLVVVERHYTEAFDEVFETQRIVVY